MSDRDLLSTPAAKAPSHDTGHQPQPKTKRTGDADRSDKAAAGEVIHARLVGRHTEPAKLRELMGGAGAEVTHVVMTKGSIHGLEPGLVGHLHGSPRYPVTIVSCGVDSCDGTVDMTQDSLMQLLHDKGQDVVFKRR